MSNPLKKTMVFLGLAEEELEEQQEGRTQHSSSGASPVQPVSDKSDSPEHSAVKSSAPRAAVTPLRKVTPTRQVASPSLNEILTVHPTQYSDAAVIAESFREGIPVVINLSQMSEAEAKRLIDFASGLSMGLRGRIERVTSKVFLLTPEHIVVSGEERDAAEDSSFFVKPSA